MPRPALRELPPVVADGALAAALLMLGIVATNAQDPTGGELAVSAAMVAPLAFRRVAPEATFAVVLVLAAASLVLSDRVLAGDPAPLVALFSLVAYAREDRLRRAGLAVVLLGAIPTGARWAGDAAAWAVAGTVGIVVVHLLLAAALGELRRAALARAAGRLRAAAEDERTRIARELHDVVAHALAVVVVQADAGRFAAATDPPAAAGALETIAATARAALTDMRAALGALRDADAPGEPSGPDGRSPQPGERDVPALVARLAAAGLRVEHVVEGAPRALPAAAGLAVYRVVQEALTNVVKHGAGDAIVVVRLIWTPDAVVVDVTDDGGGVAATAGHGPRHAGPSADGAGSGLVGMRERVGLAGGTVEAGPENGGWRVQARIPA